jgi:hypothetical protein
MRGSAAVSVLVILGACGGGDPVDGAVDVEIAEYDAAWSMTPSRCVSGEHQGFLGVDLLEGDDAATLVRLVIDPVEGASFGTNVPGTDRSVFIDAGAGCELFDVAVARQNSRFNNYWNVAGHALVDCSLPGLELHAELQFSGCH